MHRFRMSTRRRLVGVITAAFAALAMLAQPALAASGYVQLHRPFAVAGDRNQLRQDMRVNDPSVYGSVGTNFLLGPDIERGTHIGMSLVQMGKGVQSRGLRLQSYGKFKNVSSPNNICRFDPMSEDGAGLLNCDDKAFDWATGATYRVQMTRGDLLAKPVAKNTNGYYWILQIYRFDTTTRRWVEGRKIVSFRLPVGLFAAEQQGPYVFANFENCAAIDSLSATFGKPFGSGSTTTWKKVVKHTHGCDATTTITNYKNGAVKLSIAS